MKNVFVNLNSPRRFTGIKNGSAYDGSIFRVCKNSRETFQNCKEFPLVRAGMTMRAYISFGFSGNTQPVNGFPDIFMHIMVGAFARGSDSSRCKLFKKLVSKNFHGAYSLFQKLIDVS
jgi:hypothetical protein